MTNPMGLAKKLKGMIMISKKMHSDRNAIPFPVSLKHLLSEVDVSSAFLNSLKLLYDEMDRKYQQAASYYGFVCNGCEDNCCRSQFYHHTLVEYLYLHKGFRTLPEKMRQETMDRARDVYQRLASETEKPALIMCPLNENGRCILYLYRPMICRLHGIPHELRKPGTWVQHHPGCKAFHDRLKSLPYFRFDRTPFYLKLAYLEKTFRDKIGNTERIRLTVAEMLLV